MANLQFPRHDPCVSWQGHRQGKLRDPINRGALRLILGPVKDGMANGPKHMSVCICTYERPSFLKRLLEELGDQDTRGLFTYSIDDITVTRPSGQGKTAFNNQHGWLDSRGVLHVGITLSARTSRTADACSVKGQPLPNDGMPHFRVIDTRP